MAAEPNLPALARVLSLPADADEAEIAAGLRRLARTFRRMGRPFPLPVGADLKTCLAAFERRLEEERELCSRLFDEMMGKREGIERADKRIFTLQIVEAAGCDPRTSEERIAEWRAKRAAPRADSAERRRSSRKPSAL